MIEYVADQLIASAKRRGRIPDSAFTTAEWLQIANEEMETYLAPLILKAQEDYYLASAVFALTALTDGAVLDLALDAELYVSTVATSWRIPPRAAGGALRDLSFLDASANTIEVPRISIDDREQATWGFTLTAQTVDYVNRVARAGPVALRMMFSMAPSMLAAAASCAKVATVAGTTVTVEAMDAAADPLSGATAYTASFPSATAFDFLKATPGFEVVGMDRAGSYSGGTITLSDAAPLDLEVGDYVALPHYSPVPQCPTALWGLFAQAVAATALEQMGALDQAQQATARRELIAKQVLPLLQNRVKGSPQSIMRRHGVLNATRRW